MIRYYARSFRSSNERPESAVGDVDDEEEDEKEEENFAWST